MRRTQEATHSNTYLLDYLIQVVNGIHKQSLNRKPYVVVGANIHVDTLNEIISRYQAHDPQLSHTWDITSNWKILL